MTNLFAKIRQSIFLNGKILLLTVLTYSSCKEKEPGKGQPPELWFVDYNTIAGEQGDSLLIIKLGYKDQDGDIGLNLDDTFPPFNEGSPYNHNLNINLFEWKNGKEDTIFVFGTKRPEVFHQRIPDLSPTGSNKRIEGTIEITFPIEPPLTLYQDVIKGYLKLTERKLLSSAIISSDLIYLDH